jgi:hypothetical protein
MNSAIRWRIISLQAVMVVVLAGASIFAFSLGTFTTNQIKDELTSQQIFFPAASQIKAGGALDPAEFPQEIRDQAGNQVTDGNQARIYANDFIGKHRRAWPAADLPSMGDKINAVKACRHSRRTTQLHHPRQPDHDLNAQRDTLFRARPFAATCSTPTAGGQSEPPHLPPRADAGTSSCSVPCLRGSRGSQARDIQSRAEANHLDHCVTAHATAHSVSTPPPERLFCPNESLDWR